MKTKIFLNARRLMLAGLAMLTIGVSQMWAGTVVNQVANITSGSQYRIKCHNANAYLTVPASSGSNGGRTSTESDGTIFTFTKENTSWYVTFTSGGTTYYMTVSTSNAKISYTTTKTSIVVQDLTKGNGHYIDIGQSGQASSDWHIRFNSDRCGFYKNSSNMQYTVLSTAGASTFTVTYNANNATSGTVPTDATAYSSGATVTVKGNTGNLARTGYAFGGWNTQADGNGTNYAAGSGTFTISANTTLYAKWNPTYTLTYNGNGNTSGSVPVDSRSPYSSGATVTVLGNTGSLVKTGWTFAGWNTNSTGTGTNRAAGSTFSITANTTLYAKWTCTVTWSVDGHDDVYSQQTITYNPSGSKVSSVPTPNPASYCGQVFAGWTTAAIDGTQGSAPTPLFKTIGDSPNLNSTGSVTFYAVFADYDE